MSFLPTDITPTCRALLNDVGNAIYTDSVLLPFIAMAWDQLSDELAVVGADVVKKIAGQTPNPVTTVTIPASTTGTVIDPVADAAYGLTDMYVPIKIEEKASGEPDSLFEPLVQKDWDDKEDATNDIRFWTWKNFKLYLRKCTTTRLLRIQYLADLPAVTATNTPMAYQPAKQYIAAKTAALAALYIGENPSRSQMLDNMAAEHMDNILTVVIKGMQNMPARHKPFQSFRTRRLI